MARLLVIAMLAGERVAFPSELIDSVVEIGPLTPVPGAAAHVAGLAALRSRVLTVIDCRASREPGTAVGNPRDALAVIHGGHHYALLVDRIEDVVEASGDAQPPPPNLSDGWRRVACGHIAAGEDLFLLADLAALIAGPDRPAAPLNRPLTLCR